MNAPGSNHVLELGGFELLPEAPTVKDRISALSPAARLMVEQMLKTNNMQRKKDTPGVELELTRDHYHVIPVQPLEFIRSSDFLNLRTEMYPLLQDRIIRILRNKRIREVIFTGGIGWGKSWLAAIGMCYELYKVLCMKDPMKVFAKAANSPITFATLSISWTNARDVMWSYVANNLLSCPFFRNNKRFIPKISNSDGTMLWQDQNVQFKTGTSNENSIIGQNVIGGTLDEANFLISAAKTRRSKMANEFDQAQILYDNIENRRTSRFLLPNGDVLAKLWLVSSKQFPGDFLERRIEIAKRAPGTMAVLDYPQWLPQMTHTEHPYGTSRFYVFLGNAKHPSRMLGEDVKKEEIDVLKENMPKGCRVQSVPLILKQRYLENFYGAVKDISGWSILAKNPFFENSEMYKLCVCRPDLGDVQRVHPFDYDEPFGVSLYSLQPEKIPTVFINADDEVFDQTNPRHVATKQQFNLLPAVNPTRARYIHVDLGRTKDGAAFAIGHFGGYKEIITTGMIDGKMYCFVEERPITIIDMMLRVYAPKGGKIEAERFRQLIMAAIQYGHYPSIRLITYDVWQSNDSVDAWESYGIPSHNKMSLDRTDKHYITFRQSIIDQRTSYYDYSPLFMDMSSLEHDVVKGKIDHTAARDDGLPGTKDVSDCVAAIHAHVNEEYKIIRSPMPIELGKMENDDKLPVISLFDGQSVDSGILRTMK